MSSTSSPAVSSGHRRRGSARSSSRSPAAVGLRGGDDQRIALREGEAALVRFEFTMHSKGSESGMTAFMLQVRDLTVPGEM